MRETVLDLDEQDSAVLRAALTEEVARRPEEPTRLLRRPDAEEMALAIAMRLQMEALVNGETRAKLQTHEYRGHRGFTQFVDEATHAEMERTGNRWVAEEFRFYAGDAPSEVYADTRAKVVAALAAVGERYFETCNAYRMQPRHGAFSSLRDHAAIRVELEAREQAEAANPTILATPVRTEEENAGHELRPAA